MSHMILGKQHIVTSHFLHFSPKSNLPHNVAMAGARKSVEAAMPYGTELSAPTIGRVHVTRKFFWFVAMDVDVWSHKIAVGQGCLCPISTHLSMFVSVENETKAD